MVQGVQFRRGTTAEHSVFTGQSGEITVDTDKNVSVIHDGATVGGHPLVGSSTTQRITNKDINATNINVSGVSTLSGGVQGIGIYSGGNLVTTGIITALNFVGSGNTFAVVGNRIDISIAGGGGGIGTQWVTNSAGISTLSNVGIGTTIFTGTAEQKLQVSGGAYISGRLGIGITNPTSKLQVQGSTNINNTLPVTVSYASSFSVSAQETTPEDVSFSNDGKTMYVLGGNGDDITYYTLSTPWDITTSTFVSQYSVAGQLTLPFGLYFKPDGTKFYVVGTAGVGAAATSVNQYTCSTPWNLTTASYDSVSFSVISQDNFPRGVEFKPDGTKMYVVSAGSDTIYQYSLSTPWNVSTASYDSISFLVSAQETVPQSIRFSLDGTKLLLTGTNADNINYYTLSTPWDVSSTSFVGIITSLSSVIGEGNPVGLYWKPDGSKLYVTGNSNDSVYQFNVTSNADLELTGKLDLYGNADVYENLSVFGEQNVYENAYFANRVGVGTTNPQETGLTVLGKIVINQDAGSNNRLIFRGVPGTSYRWNIDNYSSANNFRIFREDDATTSNGATLLTITPTGTVSANTFVGDGSGLTGIVGSGSGVIVRDDNTTIGTAGTINFGANLSVSPISSGIVTVTITNNVSVSGILTANQIYTSNNGTGQNIRIGDDLWVGDINIANTTRFSGDQDSAKAFVIFGSSDTVALGRTGTGSLYYGGDFTVSGVTTANSFRSRGGAPGGLGVNNNGYGFFSPGDNDSGMYSSADGQIEFYSNSNEAVRINSSQNVGIGTTNPTSKLAVSGDVLVTGIVTASSSNITGNTTAATTRFQSVGEETTRINGNTASLVYNTGGGNIAICTNPTGNITLAVTGIPVDSSFNDTSITFSVFVNQTGTARSCTAVTLNGFNATIRWAGGSLANAITGVTTSNGMDIYSFTGINTVGSASTTANYYLLGVVNGGYR